MQDKPKQPTNSLKLKYWICGAVAAVAIGLLAWSAASQATATYLTIPELSVQGPTKRIVRVNGYVVEDSIRWDARQLDLTFEIQESESGAGARLPASYHGARPDMFRDGAQVVLEGRLSSDGVFVAKTMLLQCPSKYQEAERPSQNQ